MKGETCRQILQYNIPSQEEFFRWNPALNGNCDTPWANYWYCVAAYPSGFIPMPPTVTMKPSPIPAGQTSTCTRWYQTTSDDICDDIIHAFGVFSKANFIAWNPSVGSSCVLTTDTYYCVAVPGTPTTRTSAVSTTAPPTQTPTQSGLASGCTKLWLVSRYAPTFCFPCVPWTITHEIPLQIRHVCVDSRSERHNRNTTLYLEPGCWQLELHWPSTRFLRLRGSRRVFWQRQHHHL